MVTKKTVLYILVGKDRAVCMAAIVGFFPKVGTKPCSTYSCLVAQNSGKNFIVGATVGQFYW